MDFAEFFTHSARELVPLAWKKDLLFLFDYRGPFISLEADATAMREGLQRPALAALDLLRDGFLFMAAQIELRDDATADLSISIAGTGRRADEAEVTQVLHNLALRELPRGTGATPDDGARVALGTCSITGARVSYAANRSDGILFAFDISAPAQLLDDEPAPDAEGARAWLLSHTPRSHQALVRRLQRLGWATSSFTSVQQAVDQLDRMAPAMARPALVIASESTHITSEHLRRLRNRLPPHTQVVLAAPMDGVPRPAAPDIERHYWPLSPAELHDFTRRVHGEVDTISGETLPAPLAFGDRPRALVVDDNPINLLVASGLLQVAGYEVDTVPGGEEALKLCHENPPSIVLMDVHMPGMDGLQTTRALRQLQNEGRLPSFAIVAATADAMEVGQQACYAAGMDGYLCKPLSLQAIQQEFTRVMARPRVSGQP